MVNKVKQNPMNSFRKIHVENEIMKGGYRKMKYHRYVAVANDFAEHEDLTSSITGAYMRGFVKEVQYSNAEGLKETTQNLEQWMSLNSKLYRMTGDRSRNSIYPAEATVMALEAITEFGPDGFFKRV